AGGEAGLRKVAVFRGQPLQRGLVVWYLRDGGGLAEQAQLYPVPMRRDLPVGEIRGAQEVVREPVQGGRPLCQRHRDRTVLPGEGRDQVVELEAAWAVARDEVPVGQIPQVTFGLVRGDAGDCRSRVGVKGSVEVQAEKHERSEE